MNKYILFTLFVLSFNLCNAQFGIKTGANFSQLNFNSDKISSKGAHVTLFNKTMLNERLFFEYGINYNFSRSEELYEDRPCHPDAQGIICIPIGYETVSVGGVVLEANIDYTIDYATGRVTIINEMFTNNPDLRIKFPLNPLYHFNSHNILVPFLFGSSFDLGNTSLFIKAGPVASFALIGNIETKFNSFSAFEPDNFRFDRGLKRMDFSINGSAGLIFNEKWLLELSYNRGLINLNNNEESWVVKNQLLQISAGILF